MIKRIILFVSMCYFLCTSGVCQNYVTNPEFNQVTETYSGLKVNQWQRLNDQVLEPLFLDQSVTMYDSTCIQTELKRPVIPGDSYVYALEGGGASIRAFLSFDGCLGQDRKSLKVFDSVIVAKPYTHVSLVLSSGSEIPTKVSIAPGDPDDPDGIPVFGRSEVELTNVMVRDIQGRLLYEYDQIRMMQLLENLSNDQGIFVVLGQSSTDDRFFEKFYLGGVE